MNEPLKMQCPHCRSDLVVTGMAYLETSIEHVECVSPSLKEKFECSNRDCKTHLCGIVWNRYGERYFGHTFKEFINANDGPFGSWSRKANIEISKHDEDYTIIRLGKFHFEKIFHYESNENGDILKRWSSIQIWIRREHGEELYMSGVRMFAYSVRTLENLKDQFLRMPTSIYRKRILEDMLSYDRRWWRRASRIYFCFAHPIFYWNLKRWTDRKNPKGNSYVGDQSSG